jgi:inner membrane protein yeeR
MVRVRLVIGNIMDSKIKKQQLYQGQFDSITHNDRLNRFNSQQGHGFAAEQGNDLWDRMLGNDAKILGDDNAKNGADRLVNGKLIQTKYCQNARASIDAGFKNGQYRYLDTNGNPMQLEVPSDQYEEAVKIMAKKIEDGKVPNCNNPSKAKDLVRKGNITLEQATNLAKAGTIESLTFDAINGMVIGTSAAGISATITFARALWNGEELNSAIDNAVFIGIQAGGSAFIISLVSAQLTKTSLNTILLEPSVELVKALPSVVKSNLLATMRNGAPIFGSAASNNLAKLLRGNLIVSAVTSLVLSSQDILNFVTGKISGKQLFKEVTTIVSGVAGTTVGATGTTALAGALGLSLGPIGAAVTSIVGGIIGGGMSTAVSKTILDRFIEDDAIELVRIINKQFSILAFDYLLSEEEIELSLEVLRGCLIQSKLLEMFAAKNRELFADELILKCINSVIIWRTKVSIPSQSQFVDGVSRVITGLENNTFTLSSSSNINSQEIAKRLLNYNVSDFAAKKAWYVTKQFNSIGVQEEMILSKIKEDELKHSRNINMIQNKLHDSKEIFNAAINRMTEK